jgi:hypothetical protein
MGYRFKATGFTEYSPFYQVQEPSPVIELDYSAFAFPSKLSPPREELDGAPESHEDYLELYGPLTEETVSGLLTSTIISSPFTYSESVFSAPAPEKPFLQKRPSDPTYSGDWGAPVQAVLLPEPEREFAAANFSLLGFRLSALNRAVNAARRERAERAHRRWEKECESVKISNSKHILVFEQQVRSTPEYQTYLAADRQWLEAAQKSQTEYDEAMERWSLHHAQFETAKHEEDAFLSKLQAAWDAGKPEAIQQALSIAVENSELPWPSMLRHTVHFDPVNGILLIDYEFPDIERLNFVEDGPRGLKPLGKMRRRELQDRLVYTLAMRLLFDVASLVKGTAVGGLALNGHATFVDRTNGHERTETILSMFAKPEELLALRIDQINPKAAFRALKGIMTASLSEFAAVTPIMQLNKADSRIVEGPLEAS